MGPYRHAKVRRIFKLVLSLLALPAAANGPHSDISYEEHSARQQKYYLPESSMHNGERYIAYIDAGPVTGAPILLIHGVPNSSWSYRHLIELLSEKGFRVIAPDNYGFGNSSKLTKSEELTFESQAVRTFGLMDSLGIDRWTQVLHDVGGPISWEMLLKDPERIERLVILNTFAYEAGWHPPAAMGNTLVQFALGAIGFRNREIIRTTVCNMIAVPEELDNEKALEGYYLPLESGADRAYLSFMGSFAAVRSRLPNYHAALRRNRPPSIIIWGALDDSLVGEEAIPRFVSDLSIRDADIHVVGDAKHLVMEEAPRYLADTIAEFVLRSGN